jgi:hypothetical protein
LSGGGPDKRRTGLGPGGWVVWSALLAGGVALWAAGCSALGSSPGAAPAPSRLWPPPLGNLRAKAEQDALRKKVEADSFPTAAKAGL